MNTRSGAVAQAGEDLDGAFGGTEPRHLRGDDITPLMAPAATATERAMQRHVVAEFLRRTQRREIEAKPGGANHHPELTGARS